MRVWLVIIAAGGITYGLRASLILLFSRARVPPLLERAFRYVAPAVLAALSVPAFLLPGGALVLDPPRIAALLAGGAVALRFHSIIGTLVAGMAAFVAVSAL